MMNFPSKCECIEIVPIKSISLTLVISGWYFYATYKIVGAIFSILVGNVKEKYIALVAFSTLLLLFTLFMFFILVWNYSNRESIEVDERNVIIRKRNFLNARVKRFLKSEIYEIKVNRRFGVIGNLDHKFLGIGNWKIFLNTSQGGVSIGTGLTRREAEIYVEHIHKMLV